ncbi:hypothetical protein ANCCAN_24241 [Ancylostoma caninum]|uniref:Uncharacterized protein n=1 Tax=Ancylostoma caninum TaxID=29170 RepID=A0A368FEK6_ANCCA|nr:hypothetical protein ANCCAN_24241 [Ancylostoma caninum]
MLPSVRLRSDGSWCTFCLKRIGGFYGQLHSVVANEMQQDPNEGPKKPIPAPNLRRVCVRDNVRHLSRAACSSEEPRARCLAFFTKAVLKLRFLTISQGMWYSIVISTVQ